MGIKKLKDGFVNLLKGLGGSNDTKQQTSYQRTARVTNIESILEDIYVTSWVGAKVVDVPVKDAFREGRFLDIADVEKKDELDEFYIEIDEKIELAIKYARLFGGAALVIVSKDDAMNTPLSQMSQGDLLNIAVVDKVQLVPQSLNRNPLSRNYLRPDSYMISNTSQIVHNTRIIYVDGVSTTNRERENNNGFGSSIFERLYYTIQDAAQTNTALRNLIEQSNLDIVKMDGLNDAVASNAEDAVQQRIQVLSQMKSLLNTIAIDAKDDYVNISKNFSSLDSIQMNMFMWVAAAADIPFTRFIGKSADGQNATGEGDIRNYYDAVKSDIQIGKMKKIYSIIDPIINLHLYGEFEPFKYEFNPLYQTSEKEQADIDQVRANTHAIYLDRGVVDDNAVLKELQKEGVYTSYDPESAPNFDTGDDNG